MSLVSTGYGSKTSILMAMTSITSATGAQSTVIDNTATLYLDSRVFVISNGIAGGTALLDFFVYSGLGDTTYTDGATGTNGSFTSANRRNSRYLGSIQMNSTTTVKGELPGVASAFGGVMPDKWGLIALNNSGATLGAGATDHGVWYQGVYATAS